MLLIIFSKCFEEKIATINLRAWGRGQAPASICNHALVLKEKPSGNPSRNVAGPPAGGGGSPGYYNLADSQLGSWG